MKRKALRAAFPHTIPIMAGFLFLDTAYGIYMNVSGFRFWYPLLMSITIFGGSLEFVAVTMLLAPFAPVQTFVMALVIQARHLFYGISMLEKYRGMGWKKFYLIFGLCDETFSINCTAEIPADVDRGWFMFFVTLLDHLYWITGAVTGGLIGSLFRFDTEGLDFVMTAMFIVIFTEQWLKDKNHIYDHGFRAGESFLSSELGLPSPKTLIERFIFQSSALVGLAAAILCRIGFGADDFLIPTMLCIIVCLTLLRKPLDKPSETPSEKPEGGDAA